VDFDPTIGEQKIRLPVTGTPPLPLTDRADRDLFGRDYASQDPAAVGGESARPPEGVSANVLAGFVVAAWLLWAAYAWRG
jgi:hypothetical protein